MANSFTLGARKAVTNGLSDKEIKKFDRFADVAVAEGDIIVPTKAWIERSVLDEGTATEARVLSVLCVIRHKATETSKASSEIEEIPLSWLAGKEFSTASKATVALGATSKQLYLRYQETAWNASVLPLRTGVVGFAYDFVLEVGEAIDCFALKGFDFSFKLNEEFNPAIAESPTNRKWVNTDKIKDLGEGAEVDLTPTTRHRLKLRAGGKAIGATEKKAVEARMLALTGTSITL